MDNASNNKGFSLVELAIVLVIIGIILAAVLKGRDQIENAKIKRIQNDIKGFEAMLWTYYDRKKYFPGDCNIDGVVGFNAPNITTSVLPSNNTDPTVDYCGAGGIEDNVNSALSDLRVARIAPQGQPNILLAKHNFNDYFNFGHSTVNANDFNAMFVYGIPARVAKAIDVLIDGVEDGRTGRVRRHDTGDNANNGVDNWPPDVDNNELVSIEYFFDRYP